jgi:hypothetical protein
LKGYHVGVWSVDLLRPKICLCTQPIQFVDGFTKASSLEEATRYLKGTISAFNTVSSSRTLEFSEKRIGKCKKGSMIGIFCIINLLIDLRVFWGCISNFEKIKLKDICYLKLVLIESLFSVHCVYSRVKGTLLLFKLGSTISEWC